MAPINRLKYILLCLFCFASLNALASHIYGGQMTYKYLGNDDYLITLELERDCHADENALAQDNGAFVGIFRTDGTSFLTDTVYAIAVTHLTPVITGCQHPWDTCFDKITFRKQYHLPPNAEGYYVVSQRCCRDQEIVNLSHAELEGTSYYCAITPAGFANNSAVFRDQPPLVIGRNSAFTIDNGATDGDNDSLSYEFYHPERGGEQNNAKPYPTPPPFQQVELKADCVDNFFGTASGFAIDPKTGMAGGTTPEEYGKYLVGVACHEWRNGILINTVRKDYVVMVCTDEMHLDFYPNPFRETIFLHILNIYDVTMDIYNVYGIHVLRQQFHMGAETVDTHLLAKGQYIIRFSYGGQQRTVRAIKQ